MPQDFKTCALLRRSSLKWMQTHVLHTSGR